MCVLAGYGVGMNTAAAAEHAMAPATKRYKLEYYIKLDHFDASNTASVLE